PAQVQDRVGNKLARPVIGNISAPVHLDNLHALLGALRLAHQQVLNLAGAAQRVRVRMFYKQQGIDNAVLGTQGGESALYVPRSVVLHTSEVDHPAESLYGFQGFHPPIILHRLLKRGYQETSALATVRPAARARPALMAARRSR